MVNSIGYLHPQLSNQLNFENFEINHLDPYQYRKNLKRNQNLSFSHANNKNNIYFYISYHNF